MQAQNNDPFGNVKVICEPLAGTSQVVALNSPCNETLYYGTRGPGKTAIQLWKYRRRVGLGYGAAWKGIILDTEFKNLDDVVGQSKKFFNAFNDGAKFYASASSYRWVWPTGEELLFRHAKMIEDYEKFHGHEYAFIGWNELTKYPRIDLYNKMMSVNRSSFDDENSHLPDMPLEVFSTTNSFGVGRNWVKEYFIDPAPAGTVIEDTRNVFNPRTQQYEDITRTRVAIFGSYKENKFLSPAYVAYLDSIDDPNLKASWKYGSWDVASGGAIDDIWRNNIHVIDRFRIPASWRVDRSFDWGSSHPYSVGWWAESSGEEITLVDGTTLFYPKGTLIRIGEFYGTKKIGTNKGLGHSPKEICENIKEFEIAMMEQGWIQKQPKPGPADNQIDNVTRKDIDTIKKEMSKHGIRWTKSDKSPGSRVNGLQMFRTRLKASVTKEGPGVYIMRNNVASLKIIPYLPADPKKLDDVDTTSEDHIWDEMRYRVLKSSNRFAEVINTKFVS